MQLCVNVFLGAETDPLLITSADVNDDGEVTRDDLKLLKQFIRGRIDELPEPFTRKGQDKTDDALGCTPRKKKR